MTSPTLSTFDRWLESHFGVARAMSVGRAALGLMAVLRCWRQQVASPIVAVSANCCQDVIAAILGADCIPLFCDIDPTTGNVGDPEWQRARRAGATVAIVIHTYGNPVDMQIVRHEFPAPDCLVIDDAAQALGSCNHAGQVGGQGDVGLLSFGHTKHIETGGGAILFKDPDFAEKVATELASIPVADETSRTVIHSRFRLRLEAARAALRQSGDQAAVSFHGILDSYRPVLEVQKPQGMEILARTALEVYDASAAMRIRKSGIWAEGLSGCGLIPVGMGKSAVPWRYTCRLPGISWRQQHEIGETIRARGIDVSHWYLPAHWMCGYAAGSLPQMEAFSREVFQFWVDERTSENSIASAIRTVCATLKSFQSRQMNDGEYADECD